MVQRFRIFQNVRRGIVTENFPASRPARKRRKCLTVSWSSCLQSFPTYYKRPATCDSCLLSTVYSLLPTVLRSRKALCQPARSCLGGGKYVPQDSPCNLAVLPPLFPRRLPTDFPNSAFCASKEMEKPQLQKTEVALRLVLPLDYHLLPTVYCLKGLRSPCASSPPLAESLFISRRLRMFQFLCEAVVGFF